MPSIYGSRADADTYHAARANTAWAAAETAARDAALLRASVWLDGTYRALYPGTKAGGRSQVRDWPRTDATDLAGEEIADDEVPTEIEEATYEAALRELVSPNSLSPDFTIAQQSKREKVGSIEVEYRDALFADAYLPIVTVVDGILSTLIVKKQMSLGGPSARG